MGLHYLVFSLDESCQRNKMEGRRLPLVVCAEREVRVRVSVNNVMRSCVISPTSQEEITQNRVSAVSEMFFSRGPRLHGTNTAQVLRVETTAVVSSARSSPPR